MKKRFHKAKSVWCLLTCKSYILATEKVGRAGVEVDSAYLIPLLHDVSVITREIEDTLREDVPKARRKSTKKS